MEFHKHPDSSAKTIEPNPESQRRSWFPSCRAVLAAMVLMIPWVLIAVPAWKLDWYGAAHLYVYGWPFVHRIRETSTYSVDKTPVFSGENLWNGLKPWDRPTDSIEFYRSNHPVWTSLDNWKYWSEVDIGGRWYFGPMFVNAMIGLLFFAALTGTMEIRSRRRGGLFRWRVIDAFVLLAALAVPFSVIGNGLSGSNRDQKVMSELREHIVGRIDCDQDVRIPVWLNRLLDNRTSSLAVTVGNRNGFKRITGIDFSNTTIEHAYDEASMRSIVRRIDDLDAVNKLSVFLDASWQMELLGAIKPNQSCNLAMFAGNPELYGPHLVDLDKMEWVSSVFIGIVTNSESAFSDQIRQGPPFETRLPLLDACSSMPQLLHLEVPYFGLDDRDCLAIQEFPRLQSLSCSKITRSAEEILLKSNPKLEIHGERVEELVE